MEQQYLLTFDLYIKELNRAIPSYAWFEHVEDMEEFIEITQNITVTDKTRILQCEEL